MLETLLESRLKRERSVGGAVVSITAHTALIAAALYATAQAHVPTLNSPDVLHAVYFPPRPTSAAPSGPTHTTPKTADKVRRLTFVDTHLTLDVEPPSIDITSVVSKAGDFIPGRVSGLGSDGDSNAAATSAGGFFRSDQVEKQVALVPGGAPPRYPEMLRSSGVEGRVVTLFVVTEDGAVDVATIRFLRSDNPLFEDAVRTALRRMRFIPAEVGGKKVRQLVQMPFVFTLSR